MISTHLLDQQRHQRPQVRVAGQQAGGGDGPQEVVGHEVALVALLLARRIRAGRWYQKFTSAHVLQKAPQSRNTGTRCIGGKSEWTQCAGRRQLGSALRCVTWWQGARCARQCSLQPHSGQTLLPVQGHVCPISTLCFDARKGTN